MVVAILETGTVLPLIVDHLALVTSLRMIPGRDKIHCRNMKVLLARINLLSSSWHRLWVAVLFTPGVPAGGGERSQGGEVQSTTSYSPSRPERRLPPSLQDALSTSRSRRTPNHGEWESYSGSVSAVVYNGTVAYSRGGGELLA